MSDRPRFGLWSVPGETSTAPPANSVPPKAKILTKPPPIDFNKLKKATGGAAGTHRAPRIPARV